VKFFCLRSVLFPLMAASTLLLGGTSSWRAITCSYFTNEIFPITLPLTGTPEVGSSLSLNAAYNVAITPDATMAVVVDDLNIYAVDLTGPTLQEKFTHLTISDGVCSGVAITPDGSKAYVGLGTGGVAVIRLSDFFITKTFTVDELEGSRAEYIAISPNRAEAYVVVHSLAGGGASEPATQWDRSDPLLMPAGEARTYVQVIDTTTDTVIGPNTYVARTGNQIAVTPDGSEIYVSTSVGVSYLTVADHVVHTIPDFTQYSSGIAISHDGSTVCSLSANEEDAYFLVRIDVSTHTVLGQEAIPLSDPRFTAITPDGRTACVAGNHAEAGLVPADPDAVVFVLMDATSSGASPITVSASTESLAGVAITPDQAPTGRFTFSTNERTVTFDASTSDSPVGTVVLYDWDFGDGQTQTTSSPTISHTYNTSGTINATLTVTNTAGTSTDVTFTGQTVSNNGGPSARHTESIAVGAVPPRHFKGKVVIHHDKVKLKTTWKHSTSTTVRQYEIYAHNTKVATIPVFEKPHKKLCLHPRHVPSHISKDYRRYLHRKYRIRAVDIFGSPSTFINLKVKH
jgi:DNA-binding beta-propeller fold protein YncE